MSDLQAIRLAKSMGTLFFSYKNILRIEHQKCVVHTG